MELEEKHEKKSDDANEVNFKKEIMKFSGRINKMIKINDIQLNINLSNFDNSDLIEEILNWKLLLGMIGKSELFRDKFVIKIIYCLLTDNCVINNINNNVMDLDLFDIKKNSFLRLEVIDKNNRNIKIKIFTVCDSLIVFDCKDMNNYKIYELYNLKNLKDYYGSNKINFDTVSKDLKLNHVFNGDIDDLSNNFKKLTSKGVNKDKTQLIDYLTKFLSDYEDLEKKIQLEYNKFYKKFQIKKL